MSDPWVLGSPILGPPNTAHCTFGDIELALSVFDGANSPIPIERTNVSAFLPIALLRAAQHQHDVVVDADVDDAYFSNIKCGFIPLIASLSGTRQPRLLRSSAPRISGPPNADGIRKRHNRSGLLFSCGVDSFYSLHLLQQSGIRPDYLINVQAGGNDNDLDLWRVRLANIRSAAAKLDLPLIAIDTNFHVVYDAPHIQCHTIRNLSACFALLPELSTFYYSSAFDFPAISFTEAKARDISHIDHVVAATITPPGAQVIHLGWDATRVAKTKAVASLSVSHDHLDVCFDALYQKNRSSNQPLNCGRCAKCARTQLTLEHFGALGLYHRQFDIAAFTANRSELLAQAIRLAPVSPSEAEVANLVA